MRILIWHTRWPKILLTPSRLDPGASIHEYWFGDLMATKSPRWLERFKSWDDR